MSFVSCSVENVAAYTHNNQMICIALYNISIIELLGDIFIDPHHHECGQHATRAPDGTCVCHIGFKGPHCGK